MLLFFIKQLVQTIWRQLKVLSMMWPDVNCTISQNLQCQKILIVADPQILGHSEMEIAIRDNDSFLKNTFYHALHHVKPDVIIFLGDLLDEGSISTDDDYKEYKERFSRIFNTSGFNPMMIYLPGDNDIGGEGDDDVTPSKIERFNKYFPTQSEYISGNIQFIVANKVIGDHNIPQVLPKEDKFVIVLSHFPLTFEPGNFSRGVMAKLKPHMIFSAHDHRMGIATTLFNEISYVETYGFPRRPSIKFPKHINSHECFEVRWPTCSNRMGELVYYGYGFVTIGNDGMMEFGVLWSEDHNLFVFLCITILFFPVIITCYDYSCQPKLRLIITFISYFFILAVAYNTVVN